MTIGWMKLHRSLLEKPMFQDAYTLQVLIYCLLRATYKEMCVKVGNQAITLQPGQLLYGRKSVSKKLGMGEGKLRGIMHYLEQNGTIEIESHSRYSIITIVNWEQYQNGETPDFPFDCDFLEEEEPPYNHAEIQSASGFAKQDAEISASREPQYNNIKNYKNNNKIKENKTKEFQCRPIAVYVPDEDAQQEEQGLYSPMEQPSGGEAIKGECVSVSMPEPADTADSREAMAAMSMLDDAALEAYFAQCDYAMFDTDAAGNEDYYEYDTGFEMIPLDDSDMPAELYTRPGHEFAAEMVYSLSQQDIDQLEALFTGSASARPDTGAISVPVSMDEPDPYEQEWIAAHKLFDQLWKMYPVKTGREKVSDVQIMHLYEIGAKRMKQAVRNYLNKKHRVPKQYWQNGSTFFNGGYEDYLRESLDL